MSEEEIGISKKSSLSALSSSSRNFLEFIGIFDAQQFLESKTSSIALEYVSWREMQNLPPLKGSGSIATISGWKAQVRKGNSEKNNLIINLKESIDKAEASHVESNSNDVTLHHSASEIIDYKKVSSPGKVGNEKHQIAENNFVRTAQPRCHNVNISKNDEGKSSLRALSLSSRKFLDSIGVSDAEQFLQLKTSSMALEYVTWREKENMPRLKGLGSIATISGWKAQIRKASLEDKCDIIAGSKLVSDTTVKSPMLSCSDQVGDEITNLESINKDKLISQGGDQNGNSYRRNVNESLNLREHQSLKLHGTNLEDRESSLSALSSSSRKFLESIGIYDANILLESKTSSIALEYVSWRQKESMPPLKGVGSIATISGWKAQIRKAISKKTHEVTNRHIAKDKGANNSIESSYCDVGINLSDFGHIIDENTRTQNESASRHSQVSDFEALITGEMESSHVHRSNIDENELSLNALSSSSRKFLESIGICDAQQFLETKTSSMAIEYVSWRETENMPRLKGLGSIATISGWKAQIRKAKAGVTNYLFRKRREVNETGDRNHTELSSLDASTYFSEFEPPNKKVKQEDEDRNGSYRSGTCKELNATNSCIVQKNDGHDIDTTLDALSSSSRRFLEYIGIYSSQQFLETTTSSMAQEYVTWREMQNMPRLKGLGSIATISGWKAQIRKANSGEKYATLRKLHEARTKAILSPIELSSSDTDSHLLGLEPVVPLTLPSLLFGYNEKKFVVLGPTGYSFEFLLSIRFSRLVEGKGMTHLTYLGQRNILKLPAPRVDFEQDRIPILVDISNLNFQHEPLLSAPFSSDYEGCGVIDLGRYAAIPQEPGHLEKLQMEILLFLEGRQVPSNSQIIEPKRGCVKSESMSSGNVVQLSSQLNSARPMFYQQGPLQVGQTVELIPIKEDSNRIQSFSGNATFSSLRTIIFNEIGALTKTQVGEILQWISEKRDSLILENSKVVQRRIHWIASCILEHLASIERSNLNSADVISNHNGELAEIAVSLTMTTADFKDIRAAKTATELPDYRVLFQEISEELESSFEVDNGWLSLTDSSAFCIFAFALRSKCQGVAIEFLLLQHSSSCSTFHSFLLKELFEIAAEAANNLLNEKIRLEDLALKRKNVENETEEVVASGSDWLAPIFRPLEDVKSGDAQLNKHWYFHHQILRVVHFVTLWIHKSCYHSQAAFYSYEVLVTNVEKMISSNDLKMIKDLLLPDWTLDSRFLDRAQFSKHTSIPPKPDSLPLFLGLIWPILKSHYDWKIEAGDEPNEVSYFSTNQPYRTFRKTDQSYWKREERDKQRLRLDRKLNDVRFGKVPKLAKRIMIQTFGTDFLAKKSAITISDAIQDFGKEIARKIGEPDDALNHDRLTSILNGILTCVDDLFPILNPEIQFSYESQRACQYFGCDRLIPILILIPNVLQQCDLTSHQIEDTSLFVKEIVKYVTNHFEDCLDPEVKPSFEDYGESDQIIDDFLSTKFHSVTNAKSRIENGPKEEDDTSFFSLLQPGDEEDLTEFTSMALKQMTPCRATVADFGKKGRKQMSIGHPGIVCIHCWGVKEGKYFFSTSEGLGTAGGIIYSHLLKCNKFPPSELEKLKVFKGQHSETRKRLKYGAQASYFNRLWKRLQTATKFSTPDVFVHKSIQDDVNEKKTNNEEEESISYNNRQHEFSSHVDVVDHILKAAPWNHDENLMKAVKQYYIALYHGGRIQNTNAMPNHFSSEWLLSKISPVSLHKFCSGAGYHG